MTDWMPDVPTAGSKVLRPDPRAWEALASQGYGFEESIADLVDNSIDAGASRVIVHFLRDGGRLVGLTVADNGRGMDDTQLDVAMTVGGRQTYGPGSLGMFGTGLKSASLSQASSVSVISRTDESEPVGRRWVMDHAKSDHRCDIVDPSFARKFLDGYRGRPLETCGTVVRWDGVRHFPHSGTDGDVDRYLAKTVPALRRHLGLFLHRFLARDGFRLEVTVEDVRLGIVYQIDRVGPLNPFAYPVSGDQLYPKQLIATFDDIGPLTLQAHVWTPKSGLPEYKAVGSPLQRQGFYLYRNNRLVHAGGWLGLRQPEHHLALGRVAVDLPTEGGGGRAFRQTVKKSGVEITPAVASSLRAAVAYDGTTFDDFLHAAETAYRESRRQAATSRRKAVAPGKGIDPMIGRVLEHELDFDLAEESVSIRWGSLDGDVFFELDREQNTVWLNARYRRAVAGGHGSLNDAPLVKALMYMLMYDADMLTAAHLGPRAKDNLELWQTVLTAAARVELARWSTRD